MAKRNHKEYHPSSPLHDFTVTEWPKLHPRRSFESGQIDITKPSKEMSWSIFFPKRKIKLVVNAYGNTPSRRPGRRRKLKMPTGPPRGRKAQRPLILWRELENYLLDGRRHPFHTLADKMKAFHRLRKLTILQRKVFQPLTVQPSTKLGRKKQALHHHMKKCCKNVGHILKNEHNRRNTVITQQELLKQRKYTNMEHYDSDDETFRHALAHLQQTHPSWLSNDKEALLLRREDRIVRRFAPYEFWNFTLNYLVRAGIFSVILIGLIIAILYFIEKEFAQLEKAKLGKLKTK